ncbi:GTPase ObgE [Komagataeibacter xylinus E25]|nr:GTPase ObgE [Komagataeibacter xylinus E25]
MLLHLIDGTAEDVVESWRTIRHELSEYGGGLADKPEIIVLNKIDALLPEEIEERRTALERACGHEVMCMSSVAHMNVDTVLRRLQDYVSRDRAEKAGQEKGEIPAT